MTINAIDLKERISINDAFTLEERMFLIAAINTMPAMDRVEVHAPRNYLGRIDQIWAYLSVDDGGEGVCAAPLGDLTVPLIAADKRRLTDLHPIACNLAVIFKKPIRLAKFTMREDIEIIKP